MGQGTEVLLPSHYTDALQLTKGPDRAKMQRLVTSCLSYNICLLFIILPQVLLLLDSRMYKRTPRPPPRSLAIRYSLRETPIAPLVLKPLKLD